MKTLSFQMSSNLNIQNQALGFNFSYQDGEHIFVVYTFVKYFTDLIDSTKPI